MKKKVKVIMLGTDKVAQIGELTTNNTQSDSLFIMSRRLLKEWYRQEEGVEHLRGNHLYLVASSDTKGGDWYIYEDDLRQVGHGCGEWKSQKIIATTDTEMKVITGMVGSGMGIPLPAIPVSFVKAYVEAQGKIDEVQVELRQFQLYIEPHRVVQHKSNPFKIDMPFTTNPDEIWEVKTTPDNTVIIDLIEEKTYTKDEAYGLCEKAYTAGAKQLYLDAMSTQSKGDGFKIWIKENL